jgi:hypothetical protein
MMLAPPLITSRRKMVADAKTACYWAIKPSEQIWGGMESRAEKAQAD